MKSKHFARFIIPFLLGSFTSQLVYAQESETLLEFSCDDLLAPPSYNNVESALARQVGRGEYSSGHPAMQALNPVVYQLILSYDWC